MKPFNLDEAKQGKPICTRDGRKTRIIATDLKDIDYHIVAAVYDPLSKREDVRTYTSNGEYNMCAMESDLDLFMVEQPQCPFKPFDKVLVRDTNINKWDCDIFNRYEQDIDHPFDCLTDIYAQCIPYNEETEHLIGTTDAPPQKYVIW